MENEELKNENNEMTVISGINEIGKRTETKARIFTNITDQKKIFNLESHVDCLLNDCEGEAIRVKEVLIKRFEKPLKEPIVDEATGEIVKDKDITMSCILIDEAGKSYATGSKIFTIQMMRYLQMFNINQDGFEIRITKTKQQSGNKALSFELI